jgi:myo-inositol-1(or 4)-monophosphatase
MPNDIEVAELIVRTGGAQALRRFGRPVLVAHKRTHIDPVTDADLATQRAMVDMLRQLRPEDGIVAEEEGLATSGARHWLIDPIDGTVAYVRGLPLWSCAAALCDAQGTVTSAIFDPVADEFFAAQRYGPAACNGNVITTAGSPQLDSAIVHIWCDADIARDPEYLPVVARLLRGTAVLHAGGSGSQALAWVAAGRLHGFIELYPFGDVDWDWLPGELLVKAAGGYTWVEDRWRIAAASETLGAELVALVTEGAAEAGAGPHTFMYRKE